MMSAVGLSSVLYLCATVTVVVTAPTGDSQPGSYIACVREGGCVRFPFPPFPPLPLPIPDLSVPEIRIPEFP